MDEGGETVGKNILAVAIFFTSGVWAQSYDLQESFVRYSYTFTGGVVTDRGVFKVPVPGIAEIERDRPQFNTYPQFLDYLFKQAPSLKDHFVILHHSASLQFASTEHPRVILFDGGKAFTFSEHPENRSLKVEMLEASPVDYSIQLSEITFAKNGGVKIERNPRACIACHGRPAKMLWDPYDFWPNAFGSAVGAMHSKQETAAYDRLRAAAGSSEILKRLNLLPKLELGPEEENTPFTQYVGQINLASQLNHALQSQNLNGWRFPLMSVLSSCHSRFDTDYSQALSSLLEMFRVDERAEFQARVDRIYASLVPARDHMKATQVALHKVLFPNPEVLFNIDHQRLKGEAVDMAMIRAVFDAAGVNLQNLSTSHIANDYFIGNPSNVLLDATAVLNELRPEWYRGIKYTEQTLGTEKNGWLAFDCEQLKVGSLKAPRSVPAATQFTSMSAVKRERPVINRCAKCHTEGFDFDAKMIPFDNSLELARLLRDPAAKWGQKIMDRVQRSGRGQMPPDDPLTREEIESLKEMIEAFNGVSL